MAGESATGVGASATWRQLVDLLGRGRARADEPTIARLRLLRQAVPTNVRAASARALAFAAPGPELVGLFAEDELAIAAPVLRTAKLLAVDWIAMLPRLNPEGRSVLRHRRDLPEEVMRALDAFGPTDFVLPWDGGDTANDDAPAAPPAAPPAPEPDAPTPGVGDAAVNYAVPPPPADTPLADTSFVALGDIARSLPFVDKALRQAEQVESPQPGAQGGYVIADLVARIDAFNRARDAGPRERETAPTAATGFTFETDAAGVIRRVDGVAPGPLVGVSIAYGGAQGVVRVDAAMNGALRQRARFGHARIDVGGWSDAAGSWRVAGEPMFDERTGRFLGFRAAARRPRIEEGAEPAPRQGASDAIRELVHELRTPTNAIAGFAELIEAQLLGPVPLHYRHHAATIREQAMLLIGAIDDLDTAARIEGRALDLRVTEVPLATMLQRLADELAPLAQNRGVEVMVDVDPALTLYVDERAGERLFARMLSLAIGGTSGMLRVAASTGDGVATISLPAPATGSDEEAGSLLGSEFTLRLARNLAAELGGTLTIAGDRLVVTLPATPRNAVAG
nr:HAMP domain-containing sensor histidine kinase [Sphingomonas jinjuensis]